MPGSQGKHPAPPRPAPHLAERLQAGAGCECAVLQVPLTLLTPMLPLQLQLRQSLSVARLWERLAVRYEAPRRTSSLIPISQDRAGKTALMYTQNGHCPHQIPKDAAHACRRGVGISFFGQHLSCLIQPALKHQDSHLQRDVGREPQQKAQDCRVLTPPGCP